MYKVAVWTLKMTSSTRFTYE